MIIPHRNFEVARAQLLRCVGKHRPGRIIVLIGVGGVGKTTMRWSVMRELYGRPECWGIGCIPAVEVMALLAEKAYFNSKGWAEDSFDQLFTPDISWLIRGATPSPEIVKVREAIALSSDIWKDVSRKLTETKCWIKFKNVARDRALNLYSLEHASALCINHKDTSPAHHIINLMSVMESAGSMALLTTIQTGTALWAGRSEIRRRMDVVWAAPYNVSDREDMRCYLSLLRTIGSRYEFKPRDLLGRLAPEIAAATAAVCGEMTNLLDRAESNALDAGRSQIIAADIETAYYNAKDLGTLWADVESFWAAKHADKRDAVAVRADKIWPTEEA